MLRKLCTELEDLWIEKEAYRNFILMMGTANFDYLDALKTGSLADPVIRSQTHEQFAEMWAALDEAGISAWYEDLLRQHPVRGKPS